MRRIERLINLIAALLETRQPLTAEQIRDRIAGYDQESFDAFRRAFERDKESLRAMGIPLELRKTDPFADQADGYIIPKDRYYLPHLDLEPDEIAALGIAAQTLLGAQDEAGAGVLKLSVDAPLAGPAGPRVAWGADMAAEQPLLAPLFAALLERRRVRFVYEGGGERGATRTVAPYGLVHRRGHWYLVGWDDDRRDVRSFRASRIASGIERLDGGYEIPPGFDAAAHVAEAWSIGAEEIHTAEVRFDAAMRWWAEQNTPAEARREGPEGSLEVEVPVGNPDALVSWALGFGDAITILSPPHVRRRMLERLQPYLGPA